MILAESTRPDLIAWELEFGNATNPHEIPGRGREPRWTAVDLGARKGTPIKDPIMKESFAEINLWSKSQTSLPLGTFSFVI